MSDYQHLAPKPVSPELLQYLLEQQAANLPAVRQPTVPAPLLPQSRVFPELDLPAPQTVIVQRGIDPKAQRMLALGLLLLFAGGGVDLAGHGIEAAGAGMWAAAVICVSLAVARIFAPRPAPGSRSTTIVIGSRNNVSR